MTARRLAICLIAALWLTACGPQRSTELDPKFDMQAMALKQMTQLVHRQAAVMAFADVFLALTETEEAAR